MQDSTAATRYHGRVRVHEHVRTARHFLEAADVEFAAGDALQGSEKMWGAASHAVMAVAQQRGWSFGNHNALRTAARRLTDERRDEALLAGFTTAEKFHANFYHDFMEPGADFDTSRDVVRAFVARVLDAVTAGRNGPAG